MNQIQSWNHAHLLAGILIFKAIALVVTLVFRARNPGPRVKGIVDLFGAIGVDATLLHRGLSRVMFGEDPPDETKDE